MERIADASRMVPVRTTSDWKDENGTVSARRVRFRGFRAMVLRIFGIPRTFTVHLDPLGSAVWRLLDGKRTVGEVRAELAKGFPDEEGLDQRLGKFLGEMVSRKFVELR